MNKVICDVCGTKYPESAEQCPICGCAKPENARIVSGESIVGENDSTGSYTHVKGGRFSKSNVRKRNKAAAVVNENNADLDIGDAPKEKENNTGLLIAMIALLLAIVAVMLFIFFKYFAPGGGGDDTKGTTLSVATTTVPTTEDTTVSEFPCTGIDLSATTIYIDELGDSWLLSAELTPQECTDVLTFSSSDPAVAEVTSEGRVTAVAVGEAVITVTCGDITETCTVFVSDANATTEPTAEETTGATTANGADDWKLNREDISFAKQGDSWMLYKGDVDVDDISWSTDDPAIATFEKGVVTAVGPGITNVHAEYDGTKFSCIIRCKFDVSSEETTESTEGTVATDATDSSDSQTKYVLRINGTNVDKMPWGADVTISIKESFQLTLCTENGDVLAVTWSASKENICTINGNTITGNSKGNTEIVVNYAGEIYSCRVTVK